LPNNRWQTNLKEILTWIEDGEGELSELILLSNDEVNVQSGEIEILEKQITQVSDTKIPDTLPILPLRGLVVYPQTAIPLTIGQPRSIRLVDDVMSTDQRMIGLVTAKDPNLENPNPEDLYTVGTAASCTASSRPGWVHSPWCRERRAFN
jgi:ATP-dependent Lon protease